MKREEKRTNREFLRKMSKLQRRESREVKKLAMRQAKDFDQFKNATLDFMGF